MSELRGRVPESQPASLAETVQILRKHWFGIVAAGAFGLALALAFVWLQGPKFRTSATILLERDSSGGVLGDLATLASLTSAPAAASEIMVLESRTLAEETVRAPLTPAALGRVHERHLGLTTLVHDKTLKPLALFWRELMGAGPAHLPAVLPESRAFASVIEATPDAPEKIRIRFLDERRARLSTPGLLERFGLRDDFETDVVYGPEQALEYRGVRFRLKIDGPYVGKTFVIERVATYDAIQRLMRSTSVSETALNSGVIEVMVEDSDPYRAADVTNALCNNYLESVQARGQMRSSKMVGYIEGLIGEQFVEFEAAQNEIVAIQEAQPEMVAVAAAAEAFITQMATIETERVRLDLSQFALGEMVRALERGDTTTLAGLGSEEAGLFVDPVTVGYLQQISMKTAELSALEQEYTDEHYSIVNLRGAVADLHERVRRQLEGRIQSLGVQEAELETVRQDVERELAALPRGARELAMPLLKLQIYKELFPFLMRSLQGAEMTRAASVAAADYIDRAAPPTALHSPNIVQTALVGILLGLVCGVLLAVVREPSAGSLSNARELEVAGGTRVLGAIPSFRKEQRDRTGRLLPVRDGPEGPAADAFRSLRYSLRAVLARNPDIKSIGVTASTRGEGSSTTAADLALALALDGRDILLVDAELRHPVVHECFDIPLAPGLADGLTDPETDWRTLVHTSSHPATGKLKLLTAGTHAETPSDILSGIEAQRFIREATSEHDLVLFDLPAANAGAETEALAPLLDGLLLVYRSGGASRAQLRDTVARMRGCGANVLGQVLNGLSARARTR